MTRVINIWYGACFYTHMERQDLSFSICVWSDIFLSDIVDDVVYYQSHETPLLTIPIFTGLNFTQHSTTLCVNSNSNGDVNCPSGSVIENINASSPELQNICKWNGANETGDQDLFANCIGHNSCNFANRVVHISNYVWQLRISFHCVSKYNFDVSDIAYIVP